MIFVGPTEPLLFYSILSYPILMLIDEEIHPSQHKTLHLTPNTQPRLVTHLQGLSYLHIAPRLISSLAALGFGSVACSEKHFGGGGMVEHLLFGIQVK